MLKYEWSQFEKQFGNNNDRVCLVVPMFPVFLDGAFVIALSVFSNLYLYIVPFDCLIPRKKQVMHAFVKYQSFVIVK